MLASVVVGAGEAVRRLIVVVLLILAGSGTMARAELLSSGPFTGQFASALQAAMPSTSVAVARDLQLTVNLENAYREYSSDPKRFDHLVRSYAAAITAPAAVSSAKLDRTRIVPVIKDRPWLVEVQDAFRKQDAALQPVFDEFSNELVVVYAEDRDNRTRYLTSAEDLGVARSGLRALAVANLLRIMPKIEMRQHDNAFSMITSHADYGASLLLVDDIWSDGQIKVDGDIVVAAPAKDVLLVTGSRNRKGLQAVRAIAAELVKGPYRLTETLFVYRKGGFVKFGRK
jgi:uncharacterized protein YtpQ (UPF0354 family)